MTGRAGKTPHKAALVRGEAVVRRALNATLHELGGAGYAALKIENVALRAHVNKTTIYRRWPTKEALVRAALLSIGQSHHSGPMPDTGSVREDLMIIVRRILTMARSPEGRVTMRMMAAESPQSKLGRIAASLRKDHDLMSLGILRRARQRGELRSGVKPEFLLEVLRAACMQRVSERGGLTALFVTQLIDLLLAGALEPKRVKARTKVRNSSAAP